MARKSVRKKAEISEAKSPYKPQDAKLLERTEALIRHNGKLVEDLLKSEVWNEIIDPLISETIASAVGRKTNGRWHHGEITKYWSDSKLTFYTGYQKCAMDIHNRLIDFIAAKDALAKKKEREEQDKSAPIMNPFLEEMEDAYGEN